MIENNIISGILYDEKYARAVLPYIKPEYFEDNELRFLYDITAKHINEYNTIPTRKMLATMCHESDKLNEEQFKTVIGILSDIKLDPKTDIQWLIDQTEKYCQDRAIYNAVKESILIIDGSNKTLDKGSIPKLLSDALGVSFNSSIGHDFIEDAEARFDFYHNEVERIPFDLEYLNRITKGGLPKKSLSVILGGVGGGKTLMMCHMAASHYMAGKSVLYFTFEMAEELIPQRIDANLMDITIDELLELSKKQYTGKINHIKGLSTGKLIVKEFPTSQANVNHLRFILNELKLKKNFIPDIVYLDYINIMGSARVKYAGANSYTIVKSIAEEVRGLAVEFNIPIVTATQITREGFKSSDPSMTDVSESWGVPATSDLMLSIMANDELNELGQIMVTQLKNRWGAIDNPKRFMLGIDRAKMKLYDLEDSAQAGVTDGPVFDHSDNGMDMFNFKDFQ